MTDSIDKMIKNLKKNNNPHEVEIKNESSKKYSENEKTYDFIDIIVYGNEKTTNKYLENGETNDFLDILAYGNKLSQQMKNLIYDTQTHLSKIQNEIIEIREEYSKLKKYRLN